MKCSCIKNNFDLYVGHTDCNTLILEDQSTWMSDDGYEIPDQYEITLELPSINKKVSLFIDTNKRNVFKSEDILGRPDLKFEDQFLCIKTSSCGVDYTINRIYLCNTSCKIDSFVSRAKSEVEIEKALDFSYLRDAVSTNVKIGRMAQAKELFQHLKKKLEYVQC